jgi:uncharacterized repeat protein (TIGR03803 family)
MYKWISVEDAAAKSIRLLITFFLLVLIGVAFNASAQVVTNLHLFGSTPNDGYHPMAGLVQGSDGSFYGTTQTGGTGNRINGTVFRISSNGIYTNLHFFAGSPTDGGVPYGWLVQGSDGNFYGTTAFGGSHNSGTVFRISSSGSYTSLYSFGNQPNDGAYSYAGLVQGSDGNFYGTTGRGGLSTNCYAGCGTVFQISLSGAYTNLYSFVGPLDGEWPGGGVVQGSDGNLYGTTALGGTYDSGTVFRISYSGACTNLYSFASQPNDGANPVAVLVQGSDGYFYGTTQNGGTNGSYGGTVFRISPSGSYTNLYSFNHGNPVAALVQGSDGNFYGTTQNDGKWYGGTVFRISPSGNYSNLHSFGNPQLFFDAEYPEAPLMQGSDGSFYGTTTYGDQWDEGTVFKLTIPLSPAPWPVNQITGVQPSGSDMIFNVVSIASETYQLQFSSSMTPTNWVNVPGVSVTNSIGALLTLTNSGGAVGPQGFYRFAITP